MKFQLLAITLVLISSASFALTISKHHSREVVTGAESLFTGQVKVEVLKKAEAPARTHIALVSFSKNARSAWHTHPLGQILIVKSGSGRIQAEGESMKEIQEGDVIWTPPGQKHWHGASPNSEMSHLAIQEEKDGKQVEWLEKVTDKQYLGDVKR